MRILNLAGSSLLAAVGYNPATETFVAQFHKNGKFYVYDGVPAGVFVSVITDPVSQGVAFNEKIKGGTYPYREATPQEVERL